MGTRDGDDRFNTGLLAVLAAACVVPFALSSIPEMTDLPNHVARIHVLAGGTRGPMGSVFAIDWRWIGNLGVDLPALALAPLLGVERSVALVVALTAPLTILGLWLLVRAGHGRVPAATILAVPFIWSQATLWGFANYSVAVALALVVAARWLRRPPDNWPRALLFGGGALLVWTAHAMGWGVLLVIVAGFELARVGAHRGSLATRIGRRIAIAAPLLLPLLPMAAWRTPNAARLYHYDHALAASKWLQVSSVLRGTERGFDLGLTVAILLVAVAALAAARRIEPRLAAAAGTTLLAVLLLPTTLMGSWGADMRVVPVAAMLAMLAIAPARSPRAERIVALLACLLVLARLGSIGVQWRQDGIRHAAQLALLDRVPRGGRLGFAAVVPTCAPDWPIGSDRHLGSYAITRRDAFVNTTFVVRGADLVTIRDPQDRARWTDGSQTLVVARCPPAVPLRAVGRGLARLAADFPMLWILDVRSDRPVRDPHLPGMRVIAFAPGSLLLARDPG